SLSLTPSLSLAPSLSLSLAPSLSHALSLSRPLSHALSLPLSLSRPLSLPLSHPPTPGLLVKKNNLSLLQLLVCLLPIQYVLMLLQYEPRQLLFDCFSGVPLHPMTLKKCFMYKLILYKHVCIEMYSYK
ncbi:hypothetical protein FKM82_021798, partial [Ascaphus truei]